jgi:hypothetical protein
METQKMMELLLARMNASTKEHMQEMKARMDAKLDASHKMMMAKLDAHNEKIMASLGKTETTDFKATPEEMESVTEQQEIPKEDAVVMPVREPRKRRRVCNLAAERRQKTKERTRGNSGSRRKSAATCRRLPCRAKVETLQENSDLGKS